MLPKNTSGYNWRDDGHCDSSIGDSFFPDDESGQYRNIRAIQKICGGCPVKEQCYEWALNHNVVGFWGGTTENDRAMERRRLGIVLEPEQYERHLEILANMELKPELVEWDSTI